MSPERVLQWVEVQKKAGAKTILFSSDQFLGRIFRKEGKQEILEIMQGIRDLGLAFFWYNGLELSKLGTGKGLKRNMKDVRPDDELISALFGWDGEVGCYYAYLPGERPLLGRENYKKLLPWKEHCNFIKTIVGTGVPYLRYGIIIGFEDDSEESLLRLEEALHSLHDEVKKVNPELNFQVTCYTLCPIVGTPQERLVRESGLLHFDDPALWGLWTPSVDTRYLTYKDIADWQTRLAQIGTTFIQDVGERRLTYGQLK
jgi:hypothetical protein